MVDWDETYSRVRSVEARLVSEIKNLDGLERSLSSFFSDLVVIDF